MRIALLRRITGALVALAALTITPATADSSPAATDAPAGPRRELRDELQAQVEANGLSPAQARSLQAQVDREVARTGGTQVAINQVQWDGGDTLIPLPGEARARELGVAPDAARVHGCSPGLFCLYKYRYYQGIVARLESCTWHYMGGKYLASYVNGLRPLGSRAHFYRGDLTLVTGTLPSPDKGTIPFDVNQATIYVRPCGTARQGRERATVTRFDYVVGAGPAGRLGRSTTGSRNASAAHRRPRRIVAMASPMPSSSVAW